MQPAVLAGQDASAGHLGQLVQHDLGVIEQDIALEITGGQVVEIAARKIAAEQTVDLGVGNVGGGVAGVALDGQLG